MHKKWCQSRAVCAPSGFTSTPRASEDRACEEVVRDALRNRRIFRRPTVDDHVVVLEADRVRPRRIRGRLDVAAKPRVRQRSANAVNTAASKAVG